VEAFQVKLRDLQTFNQKQRRRSLRINNPPPPPGPFLTPSFISLLSSGGTQPRHGPPVLPTLPIRPERSRQRLPQRSGVIGLGVWLGFGNFRRAAVCHPRSPSGLPSPDPGGGAHPEPTGQNIRRDLMCDRKLQRTSSQPPPLVRFHISTQVVSDGDDHQTSDQNVHSLLIHSRTRLSQTQKNSVIDHSLKPHPDV